MSTVFKPADDAFWTDVRLRVGAMSAPVLITERWARGAGMRSWYLVRVSDDVNAVRRLVRPGAGVTAYFAIDFLTYGPAVKDRRARALKLVQRLGPHEEVLAFPPEPQESRLDVAYLSGPISSSSGSMACPPERSGSASSQSGQQMVLKLRLLSSPMMTGWFETIRTDVLYCL
jgi:hypothetical protein